MTHFDSQVERDKLRARASFGDRDSDSDAPHDATPCDTDKYNKSRSDSSDRPRDSDNQLFPGDKLNQSSGTLAYFKPQSPALKLAETTETSDFDSVSTTSASYIVSHSDLESLCLDDDQLDFETFKTQYFKIGTFNVFIYFFYFTQIWHKASNSNYK